MTLYESKCSEQLQLELRAWASVSPSDIAYTFKHGRRISETVGAIVREIGATKDVEILRRELALLERVCDITDGKLSLYRQICAETLYNLIICQVFMREFELDFVTVTL